MKRFQVTLCIILCAASLCFATSTLYTPDSLNVTWTLDPYNSIEFGLYKDATLTPLDNNTVVMGVEVDGSSVYGTGTVYLGWNVIDTSSGSGIKVTISLSDIDSNPRLWNIAGVSWNNSAVINYVTWGNTDAISETGKEVEIFKAIRTSQEGLFKSSGAIPLNIRTDDLKNTPLAEYMGYVTLTFSSGQ